MAPIGGTVKRYVVVEHLPERAALPEEKPWYEEDELADAIRSLRHKQQQYQGPGKLVLMSIEYDEDGQYIPYGEREITVTEVSADG